MPEIVKMPEIVFSSVKQAVRFAESVAISPDLQSSMRLLWSTGGGSLTRDESVDIAQTITMITANCKPFKGLAVKAVYSACSSDNEDYNLSVAMASGMLRMEGSADKTVRQLISVAMGELRIMRHKELYDRRYPMTKIAKKVGVSREQYSKGKAWRELRAVAKNQLEVWISIANIEIQSQLNQIGWM